MAFRFGIAWPLHKWREGRAAKRVLNWEGEDSTGMLSPLNILHYLSAQVSLVWAVQERQGGAVF